MVCGLLAALSVMESAPVREPTAAGVNVTLIAHAAPAATDAPHVLVWAKSPDAAIPEIESAAVPVFVSVTVCGAVVVCTGSPEKVRLAGASETAGAGGGVWLLLLLPPHASSAAMSARANDAAHAKTTRR